MENPWKIHLKFTALSEPVGNTPQTVKMGDTQNSTQLDMNRGMNSKLVTR